MRGIIAADFLRLGHGKRHAVVGVADLGGLDAVLGLLLEVIGRHAEHFQPLRLVALIERLKAFELRRKTAEAGGVDHHQRFVRVLLAQIDGFLGTQLGQRALQQFRTVSGLGQASQPHQQNRNSTPAHQHVEHP